MMLHSDEVRTLRDGIKLWKKKKNQDYRNSLRTLIISNNNSRMLSINNWKKNCSTSIQTAQKFFFSQTKIIWKFFWFRENLFRTVLLIFLNYVFGNIKKTVPPSGQWVSCGLKIAPIALALAGACCLLCFIWRLFFSCPSVYSVVHMHVTSDSANCVRTRARTHSRRCTT